MTAVYVTYYPDLAAPTAPASIRRFTELAQQSGVRHLVLLSGRGEEVAITCEQIVQNSGMAWTIVRASWFNQNFSEGFFLDPLRDGVLALPAGEVREPFIDVDDIADVVVASLTEDRHKGKLYEVTGGQLLTFAEAVAEIATAADRELQYVQITNKQFAAGMTEHGVPQEVIDLTTYLFDTILDGRNSRIASGVQDALGRPPRDFTSYAKNIAATGIWGS